MNKMYLVLGDWSDDGHGKYDKILVAANKSVAEIQNAYKASCRLTGIQLHQGKDFAQGEKPKREDFADYSDYHDALNARNVAANYEDNTISLYARQQFSKFEGFTELISNFDGGEDENAEIWLDQDAFTTLWFWFVTLSLPDLKIEKVKDDEIPVINGFWDKNLNEGFGYGLYH